MLSLSKHEVLNAQPRAYYTVPMIFAEPPSAPAKLRAAVRAAHRADETRCVEELIRRAGFSPEAEARVAARDHPLEQDQVGVARTTRHELGRVAENVLAALVPAGQQAQ